MIPKDCKRLAEVDFPIAVVSKWCQAEGSSRSRHPRTLHLWWARRPLAACRSMMLALLLPDPADGQCPAEFKREARKLLSRVSGHIGETDEDVRSRLLQFVGDFANWGLSSDRTYLEVARGLVKAAHPEETPLIVDPFAGGGSIPIEALRLGCDAFASDLNPVACLILKVLLEDIPRHGPDLAEQVRRVGVEIKGQLEKELADLYPRDPDGAEPIAYLWARTVRCESPNCGAEIPLIRSFWLRKKDSRKSALRYEIVRRKGVPPKLNIEIFEPPTDEDVPKATVSRAKATCPCCNVTLPPDRVRAQLVLQRGGADTIFDDDGNRIGGALLLAVITTSPNETGRRYRLPERRDYDAVRNASFRLRPSNKGQPSRNSTLFPDEKISLNEIRRVSVPIYGATTWGDLFTARQKAYLSGLVRAIHDSRSSDGSKRISGLILDRLTMLMSAHCRWKPTGESLIDMFGRHAIGMVWDFAEASPNVGKVGLWSSWIEQLADYIAHSDLIRIKPGQVHRCDAARITLPDHSASLWFTDPPYYDSIPYAHLADCFFVWLKRAIGETNKPLGFVGDLIEKEQECVVDRPHRLSRSNKDNSFFERKVAESAREGYRILSPGGIGSVVFAHKTTEGWEALLSGIIASGWFITASWPIATELASRLNARDTASLASSVHLVCRPRPDDASVGDWGTVLRELPSRVGDWMERLQGEGVRGADLVFACIGPALEIFSRYSKVETAEGREVTLAEYLEKVWEVVGRTALEQVLGTAEAVARNGAAGAVEEDARLTALFLWTLQSTNVESPIAGDEVEEEADDSDDDDEEGGPRKPSKGYTLIYDVVRRFAQPLGIHLEDWENRIIEIKKGVVRLLSVAERAKQLFGEDGASAVADRIESDVRAARSAQMLLFPEAEAPPKVQGRARKTSAAGQVSDESLRTRREATTLDRVHAAMLLQASGRANALRALLKAEMDRGPDFLRLSNALSALYPRNSEEKRLLDAMLLAVAR